MHRNREVRLEASKKSLDMSEGLFSVGFENFVYTGVGPIVLSKSDFVGCRVSDVGRLFSDDGGKRHQYN